MAEQQPIAEQSSTTAARRTELERLLGWFDERTGMAAPIRTGMRKVFPDHWSFLLGEVALFSFVILLLTGTFLTLFYTPDTRTVIYEGSYKVLRDRAWARRASRSTWPSTWR